MAAYDNLLANVPTDLWIGGKWKKSSDGARFDVIDPATEQKIASVASASVDDAKAALDAAQARSRPGPRSKPRERGEILRKAYELIMRDAERLAKLITIENGKALSDSRGEVAYAAEFFRWYAEEGVRNLGQNGMAPASGARMFVHHKPAGVAVLVTPWNFPAAMATRKIGPALAAGCPVVLKPASETPLTMLALMPILEEAGVPAGVVNVIPSRRSGPVVDAMLHDPRVRVVSFTGSTEVGRKLLHSAADQVLNTAMELGGNAPFIVFEDADIDAAIDGAMIAKMRNMGEACTAANRFYVHEKVQDEFAKKLTAKMGALKMGNGLDDGVALGPLVNAEGRDKVVELVDDAVGKGAKILTGGKRPDGAGLLLSGDRAVERARQRQDAERGNLRAGRFAADLQGRGRGDQARQRHDYGLVAYLYTKDLGRGMRVSEKLDFGMIGLNRGLVSDPAAPFGGMKQSGIGREGAHEGLMEFLETQYIASELVRHPMSRTLAAMALAAAIAPLGAVTANAQPDDQRRGRAENRRRLALYRHLGRRRAAQPRRQSDRHDRLHGERAHVGADRAGRPAHQGRRGGDARRGQGRDHRLHRLFRHLHDRRSRRGHASPAGEPAAGRRGGRRARARVQGRPA